MSSNLRADADPQVLIKSWVGHLDTRRWVHKTSYGTCLHCQIKFINGHQHHCRLCGQMFCSRCTAKYHLPTRFKLKKKKGAVRVCIGCRDAALSRRREIENFRTIGTSTTTLDMILKSKPILEVDKSFMKQHHGINVNPDMFGLTIEKQKTKETSGLLIFCIPQWLPRGTYSNCLKCQEPWQRGHQHNCRICGLLVCSACSSKRDIPNKFEKKKKKGPQRVCDFCRYLILCGAELLEEELSSDHHPNVKNPSGLTESLSNESDFSSTSSIQVVPPINTNESNVRKESVMLHYTIKRPKGNDNTNNDNDDNGYDSDGIPLQFVKTCGAPNCDKPRVTRGFCEIHSSENDLYVGVSPSNKIKKQQNDSKVKSTESKSSITQRSKSVFTPSSGKPPMIRTLSKSRYDAGQAVESSISRPYNVRHTTHVNKQLQWSGENIEALFELRRKLGEGAFGEVWLATHRTAGFDVAVKKVMPDSSDTVQSFRDEINIIKQCRHPNIVPYYGCYGPDKDGAMWILMDACEMGALPDLIEATHTQLTEAQLSYVIATMLTALVYLHSKGINHRDIKGNNILVTKDGIVQLTDFGVSNQVATSQLQRLQLADNMKHLRLRSMTVPIMKEPPNISDQEDKNEELISMVGTPNWLAPEVIAERPVDFKSDIWSLGITAIELAERVPFEGLSWLRVIRAIRSSDPPSLKQPYWSANFRDFVAKCLVKNPHERPSSRDLLGHPFILHAIETQMRPDSISPLLTLVKRCYYLTRKGTQPMGSKDVFDQFGTENPEERVNIPRTLDDQLHVKSESTRVFDIVGRDTGTIKQNNPSLDHPDISLDSMVVHEEYGDDSVSDTDSEGTSIIETIHKRIDSMEVFGGDSSDSDMPFLH